MNSLFSASFVNNYWFHVFICMNKFWLIDWLIDKAILICPYRPSVSFWPLPASGQETYFPFVKDVYLIENSATSIKLGDNKKSVLDSPVYQGYFIATLMIK